MKPICWIFLLALCHVAAAQSSPPTSQAQTVQTDPSPTDAEIDLAKSLASMTLEEASAAIAQADPSRMTAGSAKALRALAVPLRTPKPKEALKLFLEARQVADRANDATLGMTLRMNIGITHEVLGDYATGLTCFDEAFALLPQAHSTPEQLQRMYWERGNIRALLGDSSGAEDDLNAAVTKFDQLQDDGLKVMAMTLLATMTADNGDFSKARDFYERALLLAREEKAKSREAYLLKSIALLYVNENNYPLARSYALQAIKMYEQIGNPGDLAASYVALAYADLYSGNTRAASRDLERASLLSKDLPDHYVKTAVMSGNAEVARAQKQLQVALKLYKDLFTLQSTMSERKNANATLADITEVEFRLGLYEETIRDCEAGITVARQVDNNLSLFNFQQFMGRSDLALGNREKARTALEAAASLLEQLRENAAGGEESRSTFFEDKMAVYKALVSLDASEGKWEDAFVLSEHEKGRALLDMLTRGKTTLSAELTPEEKAEEGTLRKRLDLLERKRAAVATASQPSTVDVASLDQQMTEERIAIAQFKERMYATHSDLSRRRGDAQMITLPRTAELLPAPASALVEFEVTDSATYLFVITRNALGAQNPELHGYTIPIASKVLRSRIQQFQRALDRRDPDFDKPAASLYRLLLGPAKAQLAGSKSLTIVPSDFLWDLSFQALRSTRGTYLIEDADVSYAPSLSVLNAYIGQKPAPNPGHTLLALGDPAGDLPDAINEVKTVTGLYGTPNARMFTHASASRENFRANAGTYDIVHLATHAVFDDKNPMYSHLLLADAGSTQNVGHPVAQLDASEIADMKLRARLVVLSACETAKGKYEAGEGLVGLSWSFLAAGSQATVASQWRVESASTTQLMIAFHRALRKNVPTAAALRTAELTLAHSQKYSHPYYWAGFELLGNR